MRKSQNLSRRQALSGIAGMAHLPLLGCLELGPENKDLGINVSRNIIDSYNDADGLQIIDISDNGQKNIIASSRDSVYWYEQTEGSDGWIKHLITTGYNEIEGIDAADIDGDGLIEVFILDQGAGILDIATQDTFDPTKSWSTATLDSNASAIQSSLISDISGNGNRNDIAYTYEGINDGDGGVYWQEYTGGTPKDVSNWSKYEMHQIEGAWWIAQKRRDLSRNGNTNDIVVSAREYNNKNARGEVFWLESPTDPRQSWNKTIIDDGSDFAPTQIDTGNLFANGHQNDVVAVAGPDRGNGLYIYDYSNNWDRKKILTADEFFWNAKTIDLLNRSQDEIIFSKHQQYSGFLIWDGSKYITKGMTSNGGSNKFDDRIIPWDIDNDGELELLLVYDDTGDLEWWDVTFE